MSDKEEVRGERRAPQIPNVIERRAPQTPNVIYYLCLNRIYAENAYVRAIAPVKLAMYRNLM